MAYLAYINFKPWREFPDGEEWVWQEDQLAVPIRELPQIFWEDGTAWTEANHWAIEKIASEGSHLDTAKGLMKHLCAYARFLEETQLDWRHFPIRLADRAVVRFRGDLIAKMHRGNLMPSTARSRINAIIQFYRHVDAHGFITIVTPMWKERKVVIPIFDATGFKRSLIRMTTDLAIPNRTVHGIRLEDGLLPISESHMTDLLKYAKTQETMELHLMLSVGLFTGARLGTITSLRIENLETAREDPYMAGVFWIRVGPGTNVATKLNVSGSLLFPKILLEELLRYAYSSDRLRRQSRASSDDRTILFLTAHGNRYCNNTVSSLMTGVRRRARRSGLKFMDRFKFHQTRATYGTWMMKLCLGVTTVPSAIEFVKNAMLHKNEATTLRYVKFIESNKGKQEVARAFHEVFTGISQRDWVGFNA